MFSIILHVHSGEELLGHIVTMFKFLMSCQICFQSDCSVMLEKTVVWGQGDEEEKSLLSSPGGSLDYGGASVSGERRWIVDL